ncbi:hypothetical protein SAMN05421678_11776 [Actinopolymorpha cephalotaxi]|uniref:Uncharacterized protein n=1 Tax=Actinopolymorpha cephalotaxi TaxID=504797 RepID=A0A1I2ZUH8_9ACTN|nr:hypothetical protein [Actinopolymorpha cephalotaxi]NYH84176.1 hypothetical protein [Actinopolymorpha cephalotaxi]SFH41463.1 hypothetical protein SAMN05421678_11776 [Actinopolymorpha cephalotaxi]
MTVPDDPISVQGSWTHSFEEDTPGIEVYRPTDTFPFPPARGRVRLVFDGDQVVEWAPGPDDRPRPRATLDRVGPGTFREPETGADGFEIVEATQDVLRIRRS